MLINLIIWLIVGGIIGWLASIVMKTNRQMGIIANIVVGIVGSALGHWLAGMLGIAAFRGLGSLIVSVLGAMCLIAILKAMGLFRWIAPSGAATTAPPRWTSSTSRACAKPHRERWRAIPAEPPHMGHRSVT